MPAPYEEGMQAALVGKDFYENPYSTRASVIKDFQHWFAGWCFQKNFDAKNKKADKVEEPFKSSP
jgi:hypothetical protein